jgi:hypothetical protein
VPDGIDLDESGELGAFARSDDDRRHGRTAAKELSQKFEHARSDA